MSEHNIHVFIPQTLEGMRLQSDAVALRWSFAPPMISPIPDDRGMRSGSKAAGWTWRERQAGLATLPGLGPGRLTIDRFVWQDLAMTREVFQPEQGARLAVRGSIENHASQGISLGDWAILEVQGAAHLCLGDLPAAQWKMYRNARHKNDHPIVVSLGRLDENMQDASAPGDTGDLTQKGAAPAIIADPMTVLKGGEGQGPGTLLLGFLSQLEHLSYIAVSMDERRAMLVSLNAVCEFDGCLLPAGARRETAWLLLDTDEQHHRAIRAYAEAIAALHGIAQPPPPKTLYSTWYFYGQDLPPAVMEDELTWFEQHPWPIDVWQIDEGWERIYGDWYARPDWHDASATEYAARVHAMGYQPGIWTSPYVASVNSRLVAEHPDWMLKDSSGNHLIYRNMGDNDVLDMTHPEAVRWIEALYHRLQDDWGYTYQKFDFMRAEVTAKDTVFHDPTATRAQAYRRGLQAIRRALGDQTYMLVCGGLYLPSIGIADGQRSGSDVKSHWLDPRADVRVRQNLLRYWMNRLWHQDPDSLMVRRRSEPFGVDKWDLSRGLFNDEEARTLMVNQYLGGGLVCFTERMCELDADRAALYRHCIPSLGIESAPADLFGPSMGGGAERIPALHVTHVRPRAAGLEPWHTVSIINFTDEARTFDLLLNADLLIEPPDCTEGRFLIWEFFERRLVGCLPWGGKLPSITVPPHGTRVLRIAPWDGRMPTLLATDRHLSMGGVEIAAWNPQPGQVEVLISSAWPEEFSLWVARPDSRSLDGLRVDEWRVKDGQRVLI